MATQPQPQLNQPNTGPPRRMNIHPTAHSAFFSMLVKCTSHIRTVYTMFVACVLSDMHYKSKVFIDPSCRILYSSFYIQGLYNEFGKENVSFSTKYFKELKRKQESHSYDHYMAFVVIIPDNSTTKIIIDFRDKPSVKESAYEWSDKYAKINFNINLTDKRFHDKMISIPPGFGIKIWNIWETAYYCCLNYIRCKSSPLVILKSHLADYYSQYKRPLLEDYLIANTDNRHSTYTKPYVFMIGTLWTHKNCIEGTNIQRKTFIELCKTLNCNFEGGFSASVNHPQYAEFKDLIFSKQYPVESYIKKTKLSAFVFNTPAVHNCQGWKLGEYLIMGKAIISTPLLNKLPEELVHGKNIHFVSNADELKFAIKLLSTDKSYRKLLEDGAKTYYSKYVDPKSVIENILRNYN